MKISILENNLEFINDERYSSIFKLIINAVRDYPIFNMDDTDVFFSEVKKKIGSEEITLSKLESYIFHNSNKGDENNIWIINSLSSLADAFDLMNLFKIEFTEVLDMINSIEV